MSTASRFERAEGARFGAAERAYHHLGDALGWRYLPGVRLPLDAIARALGISRQPVRDAVRRLADDGLVAISPQVGSVVVRPDRLEIEDLGVVLATADGGFAAVAARRATPDDRARLADAIAEIESLAARPYRSVGEVFATARAVASLYDELYGIATARSVADAVAGIRFRVSMLMRLRFCDVRRGASEDAVLADVHEVTKLSIGSLRSLVAAIDAGDPGAAERLAVGRARSGASRSDGYASEPLFAASLETMLRQRRPGDAAGSISF